MTGIEERRFAVVDVGSNTVKMSVYACVDDAPPRRIHHVSDTVRIGLGTTLTGVIQAERAERLLDTLAQMERDAVAHGATDLLAVATQAFRQARNGAELRRRINAETGWVLEIISGEEEARLTFQSSRPHLTPGRSTLIADIGGASTEIVVVSAQGAVLRSGSVPIGSGTLYDEHIAMSPPDLRSYEHTVVCADSAFRTADVLPDTTDDLLLPGGSGWLLERLATRLDPPQSFANSHDALRDWFLGNHGSATATMLDIQLERAFVLPASLAIVRALDRVTRPRRTRAIHSSIGAGIALEVCARPRRHR